MRYPLSLLAVAAVLMLAGFDFSKHSIPLNEIHNGGPPKDGIPALYDPMHIPAADAEYLRPDDRILGIEVNGDARAYPIRILNWHELVNDKVGDKGIVVTYCPLCRTGMIFNAEINGERYLFGVSGKLYNSDVLFYDRRTESLWSQIKMEAVTGDMTGRKLELLAGYDTTWEDWKERFPGSTVLSLDTGHRRDYTADPYADYAKSNAVMFPVAVSDKRLPVKSRVLGIVLAGKAKAYPIVKLRNGPALIHDIIGDIKIEIDFDSESESVTVRDMAGDLIPVIQAYWFAWSAFYPDTELYL